MLKLSSRYRALVALVLSLSILFPEYAAARDWSSIPVTWWPDPATGLMWTGQLHGSKGFNNGGPLSYDQAAQYCASLKLGGFTGWRLPTIDEVAATTQVMRQVSTPRGMFQPPMIGPVPLGMPWDIVSTGMTDLYLAYFPKGITFWTFNESVWTSTPGPEGSKTDPVNWVETFNYDESRESVQPAFPTNWAEVFGLEKPSTPDQLFDPVQPWKKASAGPQAICTRPMEPDLAAIAVEAGPVAAVPDVETLKKYIPFNKARVAYVDGSFQETIDDAKQALQGLPKMYRAYWAMGVAYGRLGQWDQAVANLNTASKMAKKESRGFQDPIIVESLHWAKKGKGAAAKGKTSKVKTPDWYPYPSIPTSAKTSISIEQQ